MTTHFCLIRIAQYFYALLINNNTKPNDISKNEDLTKNTNLCIKSGVEL